MGLAWRWFWLEDHFDVAGRSFAVKGSGVGVFETRREEPIFGIPQHPDRLDERVGLVVDDDVVLAFDHFRLVDRQTGILADFDFPILIEAAEITMPAALRERFAMLDDRLFDLLGKIPRNDAGRRWR